MGRQVGHLLYSYSNGHLNAVSDPTRGALVEAVEYNPAGGVRAIRTRGGVATVIQEDQRNRPASIKVFGPSPCGDGICNNGEYCGNCPQDCECEDPEDPPGGDCEIGEICNISWVASPRRPIGQAGMVTLFDSGAYQYDGAGNISRIGFDHFRYDTLNRLVMAEIVTPTSNIENLFWSYDDFGNMLAQHRQDVGSNPWSIHHGFTVAPERNQIEQYSIDGEAHLASYGDTGSLISDGSHEYVYDARDRMLEVYEAGGSGPLTARYTYDHEGYRLSKFDGATGTTTLYLRDLDGRVLSEFRRPADPQAKPFWSKDYVYAAGRHVAMVENDRPAPPGGIDIATSSYGQSPPFVSLTWEPVADTDLLEYRIYRKDPNSNEQVFVHQNLSNTAWTDNLPVSEQLVTYTYRISALDQAANESERSEPVVVTPGDGQFPGTPVLMMPTSGDRWVRLKWSKPSSPDVWSFRLYRRKANEPWSQLGGDFRILEVSDRTVENNYTYYYQVKAVDTAGLVSPPSNEQSASPDDNAPPSPPQGLVAVAGTTQVELTWQPSVSADATGQYWVYRTPDFQDPNYGDAAGTAFVDSTAAPLTTYHYRVKAKDDDGNWSALSSEVIAQTKDPSVGIPQFFAQSWDYCGEAPFACCLPQNFDKCVQGAPGQPLTPGEATHKNFAITHAQWPHPLGQLDHLRVYRRRHATDPFELSSVLPPPGPDASEYPLLSPADWLYAQFSFSPADACVPWEYRVSAVSSTTGGESSLSSPRVMPSSILIPENVSVPAERLPRDFYGNIRYDVPPMEALAERGLTLEWSSVNSSCASSFAGYHVYRQRRREHTDASVDPNAPPIRMTRQPLTYPQLQVQYLSNMSEFVIPGSVFPGLDGPGDYSKGITYAVTSVDAFGKESNSSSGVYASTNSERMTERYPFGLGAQNHEAVSGLPMLPLDPNAVEQPGSIDANMISWQWHYGHGQSWLLRIGPRAGNWVMMKWGDRENEVTGNPNEFRISRQMGSDPNYYVLDLGFIPGDDLGLRKFIWQVDPKLACQDANYRVQGVDVFGRSGPWSDPPTFVPRHKLIPENPSAVPHGTYVTIGWGALPGCAGSLIPLTGYKVLRSNGVASCNGTMPPDANFTVISGSNVLSQTTFQDTPTPPDASTKYWYRVKAYWGGTEEVNASGLSAGVCTSASLGPAPKKLAVLPGGHPAITNWWYPPQCYQSTIHCPMAALWEPVPASAGAPSRYNIYRSNAPISGSCEDSTPPPNPGDYTRVNDEGGDPITESPHFFPVGVMGGYWYRMTAVYPWGAESEMSPPACSNVGGDWYGWAQYQPTGDPGLQEAWHIANVVSGEGWEGTGLGIPGEGMCLVESQDHISGSPGGIDGKERYAPTVAALPRRQDVRYSNPVMQYAAQEPITSDSASRSPHRVIGQASSNPPIRMTFYHLDHLGTPRVITDVMGQPISTHKYLPFGEELNPPPSTNSHRFTGHERDKETGLDYMLARYYSPAGTMRFASVDPGDDTQLENPQSWNKYAYVENNPLKFLDPNGKFKVVGSHRHQNISRAAPTQANGVRQRDVIQGNRRADTVRILGGGDRSAHLNTGGGATGSPSDTRVQAGTAQLGTAIREHAAGNIEAAGEALGGSHHSFNDLGGHGGASREQHYSDANAGDMDSSKSPGFDVRYDAAVDLTSQINGIFNQATEAIAGGMDVESAVAGAQGQAEAAAQASYTSTRETLTKSGQLPEGY